MSACDFVFGSFRYLVKKGVFVRGIKVEVRKKKEKTNKTKQKNMRINVNVVVLVRETEGLAGVGRHTY